MTIDGAILAYPIYAMCAVLAIFGCRLNLMLNRWDREQRAQAPARAELDVKAYWVRMASEPPQFVVDELP